MDAGSDFRPLELDCQIAVEAATRRLEQVGLRILRSFDLSTSACVPHPGVPCPHHGTVPCDCQLVVLLVYGEEGPPVSLVAHGYDDRTWFSVVDDPGQPVEGSTRRQVACTLEEWSLGAPHDDGPNHGP